MHARRLTPTLSKLLAVAATASACSVDELPADIVAASEQLAALLTRRESSRGDATGVVTREDKRPTWRPPPRR